MKNLRTIYNYFHGLNMLKTIGYFGLAMLTLCMSCEDLLKEEPKNIAAELFYNTADELETGVNAILPANAWKQGRIYSGA